MLNIESFRKAGTLRKRLRLKYTLFITLAVLVAMAAGAAFAFTFMAANTPTATVPGTTVKPTELVTAIIGTVAVLVALGTYAFNWAKTRKELFLKIHEQLMALELQEGRRLLHKLVDPSQAELGIDPESADYQKINRAVAMFDVMGMYAYLGYIPKSWVLEEWGRTLDHAKAKILFFAQKRNAAVGLWPHLRRLLNDAETWAAEVRSQEAGPK